MLVGHDTVAQDADAAAPRERGCVHDRRGDTLGTRTVVEVDRDALAEHLLGVPREDGGGLAREIRARDREGAGLLEELQDEPVRRHPHRNRAPRVSEVPRERGLGGQDDRQSTGPESLDEQLDRGRTSSTRARSVVVPAMRRAGATAVRVPSRREAPRPRAVEGVGGDTVDGVGREDDELTAADRLARLAHPGQKLRLVVTVEEGGHDRVILSRPLPLPPPETVRAEGAVSDAVAEGQVGVGRGGEPPVGGEDVADRGPLGFAVLDHDERPRMREAQARAADLSDDIQTVLTAVERLGRIEQPHLRSRGIAASGT